MAALAGRGEEEMRADASIELRDLGACGSDRIVLPSVAPAARNAASRNGTSTTRGATVSRREDRGA
jgi:hypothetical protein